jgi:peptide/nickel transport system ATP-binding protein
MSALVVDDLHVRIGAREVLRGVSLTAHAGEITALVGESGSGKTMTLLAAARLLPRGATAHGRIALGEEDVLSASEARMCALRGARIGMIFQEPMSALNPVQTIGVQIGEALRLHRGASRAEAAQAARAALDGVGLASIGLDRYPHELSGGQRQRVAIAIATVLDPAVLLADEPTTALDVITQAGVMEVLGGVAARGAGVILVTHDLALAAAHASRIAIMKDGAVAEEARAPKLLAALTTSYAKSLRAAAALSPRMPPTTLGDVVAQARDVVVHYRARGSGDGVRALDGVSLDVRAGECVGVAGESGSGKSTLARALVGLQPLTGGAVTIGGLPWTPHATALRRRAQIVFQDPYGSFDPRWRVGRIVAEPLHLEGANEADARARAAQALESVGLAPADAQRFPHGLSGGQRQRIAIARALITRPALVLLDEAVSALDATIRAEILSLLDALQRAHGLAYVFVTHDLGVLSAIADRVLIMQKGRVVEEGEAARVLGAPQHAYTQALLAATPRFDSEEASHAS